MQKKHKGILLSLATLTLIVASVLGTLAYFTDVTEEVTNTFSIGNVSFDKEKNGGLDERNVDLYGNLSYIDSASGQDKIIISEDGNILDIEGNTLTDVKGIPLREDNNGYLADQDGKYVDIKGILLPVDQDPIKVADLAPRVQSNKYKLIPGRTYHKDPTLHIAKESEPAWLYVKVINSLVDIETDEEGRTINEQMETLGWVNLEDNIWRYDTIVDARLHAKDIVVFNNFTTKTVIDNSTEKPESLIIKAFAIQSQDIDLATADTQALEYFNEATQ